MCFVLCHKDVEAFVKAMQEHEKKTAEKKDGGKEEKMEH